MTVWCASKWVVAICLSFGILSQIERQETEGAGSYADTRSTEATISTEQADTNHTASRATKVCWNYLYDHWQVRYVEDYTAYSPPTGRVSIYWNGSLVWRSGQCEGVTFEFLSLTPHDPSALYWGTTHFDDEPPPALPLESICGLRGVTVALRAHGINDKAGSDFQLLGLHSGQVVDLARFSVGRGTILFRDFDSDGVIEICTLDMTLAYWSSGFNQSPFMLLIYSWNGSEYRLDNNSYEDVVLSYSLSGEVPNSLTGLWDQALGDSEYDCSSSETRVVVARYLVTLLTLGRLKEAERTIGLLHGALQQHDVGVHDHLASKPWEWWIGMRAEMRRSKTWIEYVNLYPHLND